VGVGVAEGVAVGVGVALSVDAGVAVADVGGVGLGDEEGVAVGDAVGVGVAVAVGEAVAVREAVAVGVGVNGDASGASPYQPTTSKITCVCPMALKTSTLPPAPTFTVTRFGTVWPAAKLRFDASGLATPDG